MVLRWKHLTYLYVFRVQATWLGCIRDLLMEGAHQSEEPNRNRVLSSCIEHSSTVALCTQVLEVNIYSDNPKDLDL